MANEENVQKWIDALRSDEFKQGKGALRLEEDGEVFHCCLGVACELYRRENPEEVGDWRPTVEFGQTFGILDADAVLPDEVRDWLGLDDRNPEVHFADEDFALALVNDTMRADFKRIADLIQSTYLP
jgi:hypothetical protein